jgi:LacI family transcriptional regulator
MKLTLEEVAKLSGLSRSTISRVINDDPRVSDATRERVKGVVRQLNYQPNAAARGLASGRTRVLGVVLPQGVAALFSDPYFPILIQGMASASNDSDYSVMLWLAQPDNERRTIQQILQGGLIDGVIVSSMLLDDPLILALIASGKPFVLVGRHPTNPDISYVDADNLKGATGAVAYLLRLGRRRVATITGPLNMIAGLDRRDGYLAAWRERGLVPDPAWMVEGDFTEEGGYLATQRLLSHQPDAIFAASDVMALGALRALREAGRRVPEEVALVGFDDLPFAARTEPPLTTVRQSVQRTGQVAAETLIEMIEERTTQPRRIILPTELMLRASCGSPLPPNRSEQKEVVSSSHNYPVPSA